MVMKKVSLEIPVKTAIERGFVLRAVYERGERAGRVRNVLILALMESQSGVEGPHRPPHVAWLAYDPTASHHTYPFSTMDVAFTKFRAVVATSRVPQPQTVDELLPTQTAKLGRVFWRGVNHMPPRGYSLLWEVDGGKPIPADFLSHAGVQVKVPVVLEVKR